jgi:hypothetical protein
MFDDIWRKKTSYKGIKRRVIELSSEILLVTLNAGCLEPRSDLEANRVVHIFLPNWIFHTLSLLSMAPAQSNTL